ALTPNALPYTTLFRSGPDSSEGGTAAARDRTAGGTPRRPALSVARENDVGRHLTRHVRGVDGRGGSAHAGLREGHSASGRRGIRSEERRVGKGGSRGR